LKAVLATCARYVILDIHIIRVCSFLGIEGVKLSLEEQEALIDVLSRRAADRRRDRLGRDIRKARKGFKEGQIRPATPDDILSEI
jgi:hypothetical protein